MANGSIELVLQAQVVPTLGKVGIIIAQSTTSVQLRRSKQNIVGVGPARINPIVYFERGDTLLSATFRIYYFKEIKSARQPVHQSKCSSGQDFVCAVMTLNSRAVGFRSNE
jgi:hypothetical protein